MNKSFIVLPVVLGAALLAGGCASERHTMGAAAAPPAVTVKAEDRQFVAAAAGSGLYEVAVARLAASRASPAQVKSSAAMLVQHHSMANDELMAIARARGITPPTAIPADKQARIDTLSKLNGAAFDAQFVRTVGLQDHQADIALFEQASRTVSEGELRAWVVKTLPVLRSHLQNAQQLAGTLAG